MEEVNSEQQQVRYVSSGADTRSKKTWIILSIIIVVLILAYVIARIIFYSYLTKTSSEMIKDTLYKVVNRGNNNLHFEEYNDSEDINELKNRLEKSKEYTHIQLISLKANKDMEIYQPKQGSNVYEKVKVNGSEAIITFTAEALLLDLIEYPIYILEDIESTKQNTESLNAHVLDQLAFLSKKVACWQIFKSVISMSLENYSVTNNTAKIITNIEIFDKSLMIPSEEEINKVIFKDKCVKYSSELQKSNPEYKNLFKSSFLGSILLTNPSMKKTCEKLEEYEKANAVKILKANNNELNPLVSIQTKLHLNIFVKCPGIEFEQNSSCMSDYLTKFQEDFSNSIKK